MFCLKISPTFWSWSNPNTRSRATGSTDNVRVGDSAPTSRMIGDNDLALREHSLTKVPQTSL